jgi:hypothetical protein
VRLALLNSGFGLFMQMVTMVTKFFTVGQKQLEV